MVRVKRRSGKSPGLTRGAVRDAGGDRLAQLRQAGLGAAGALRYSRRARAFGV